MDLLPEPSRRRFLLGLAGSALGAAACDPGGVKCPPGQAPVGNECVLSSKVQVNSVGYLPGRAKRASIAGGGGAFVVRRGDGSEAWSGQTTGPARNDDTGEEIWTADFSALAEAGEFYLEVHDVGRSPSFVIAPDVYRGALRTVMLGFYGQRCGAEVSFEHAGAGFSHGSCHGEDAYLDYVGGSGAKPSLRGWHDAGDYGKYTVNGAFSVAFLLKAWEYFEPALAGLHLPIPEHGGPLPDLLAEAKWQLDWLLTMQLADGRVSHKVTAKSFEGLTTPPDGDQQPRYFAPAGTAAAADFTAVMALSARVYAPYDESFAAACLAAAELSYAYLRDHPAHEDPDLGEFETGPYLTEDLDDRLWAAVEMWETTGGAEALADAEARATGNQVRLEWDWSNLGNLGLFTYLLSSREGRDPAIVAALEASAVDVAGAIVENTRRHGYGRGIGPKYYWGINGTVVRTVMNLQVAYRINPDDSYLDAAVQQIDHVLGRNVYGRSQVTGLGHRPPILPHHRPSAAGGRAWPGLLVGGPWPEATSWVDETEDYETNEVAINWSAALAYAMAGLLP